MPRQQRRQKRSSNPVRAVTSENALSKADAPTTPEPDAPEHGDDSNEEFETIGSRLRRKRRLNAASQVEHTSPSRTIRTPAKDRSATAKKIPSRQATKTDIPLKFKDTTKVTEGVETRRSSKRKLADEGLEVTTSAEQSTLLSNELEKEETPPQNESSRRKIRRTLKQESPALKDNLPQKDPSEASSTAVGNSTLNYPRVIYKIFEYCTKLDNFLNSELANGADLEGLQTMGASRSLKEQALPVLQELAVQMLSIFATMKYSEIVELVTEQSSRIGIAYAELKKLFDGTKRVYASRDHLICISELKGLSPEAVNIAKKANLATYVTSCFGSGDIGFFHLDKYFLDTFASDGNRLLKQQASLWLNLKTQAYFGAMQGDSDKDEVLADMFPKDLADKLLTRRPGTKSLASSESEFVQATMDRYHDLSRGHADSASLKELREKWTWDDFLQDLASYLRKNFESIVGVPPTNLEPLRETDWFPDLGAGDQTSERELSTDPVLEMPRPRSQDGDQVPFGPDQEASALQEDLVTGGEHIQGSKTHFEPEAVSTPATASPQVSTAVQKSESDSTVEGAYENRAQGLDITQGSTPHSTSPTVNHRRSTDLQPHPPEYRPLSHERPTQAPPGYWNGYPPPYSPHKSSFPPPLPPPPPSQPPPQPPPQPLGHPHSPFHQSSPDRRHSVPIHAYHHSGPNHPPEFNRTLSHSGAPPPNYHRPPVPSSSAWQPSPIHPEPPPLYHPQSVPPPHHNYQPPGPRVGQPHHQHHHQPPPGPPAPYLAQRGPLGQSPYGPQPQANPYFQQNQQSYESPFASHGSPLPQGYPVQYPHAMVPPYQSAPTKVLYEQARAVANSKNSSSTRMRPTNISQRRPWTLEEENALMEGIDIVKGPHWSQILAMHGPGGTLSEALRDRNQVQLKDKARNLKLFFLKANIEVPYYLSTVTGDLKRASGPGGKSDVDIPEGSNGDHSAPINSLWDEDGETDAPVTNGTAPRNRGIKDQFIAGISSANKQVTGTLPYISTPRTAGNRELRHGTQDVPLILSHEGSQRRNFDSEPNVKSIRWSNEPTTSSPSALQPSHSLLPPPPIRTSSLHLQTSYPQSPLQQEQPYISPFGPPSEPARESPKHVYAAPPNIQPAPSSVLSETEFRIQSTPRPLEPHSGSSHLVQERAMGAQQEQTQLERRQSMGRYSLISSPNRAMEPVSMAHAFYNNHNSMGTGRSPTQLASGSPAKPQEFRFKHWGMQQRKTRGYSNSIGEGGKEMIHKSKEKTSEGTSDNELSRENGIDETSYQQRSSRASLNGHMRIPGAVQEQPSMAPRDQDGTLKAPESSAASGWATVNRPRA